MILCLTHSSDKEIFWMKCTSVFGGEFSLIFSQGIVEYAKTKNKPTPPQNKTNKTMKVKVDLVCLWEKLKIVTLINVYPPPGSPGSASGAQKLSEFGSISRERPQNDLKIAQPLCPYRVVNPLLLLPLKFCSPVSGHLESSENGGFIFFISQNENS